MSSLTYSRSAYHNAGNINTRIITIIALAAVLSFSASMPLVAADTANNTINITITVNTKTLVTVDPNILQWVAGQAVDPGTEGVVKAIQVENMGSTNITQIWANTTYEGSSPFGSGAAANYDAGNFLALSRTNNSGDYFYFVNRVDYNETHEDIYLTLPAGWDSYGRFRDGPNEYFWVVDRGNDCTNGTFYIGKTPHNTSQTGTVDFSACDATLINPAGAQGCRSGALTTAVGGGWGYALAFIGPNANYHNYTVSMNADCNVSIFNHWNKDMPGGLIDGNYTDFLSSTTIHPGDALIMYAKVKVAFGTAAGSIKQGFLTIIAQSA